MLLHPAMATMILQNLPTLAKLVTAAPAMAAMILRNLPMLAKLTRAAAPTLHAAAPGNSRNNYADFSHVLHAPKKSAFKTSFSKRELRIIHDSRHNHQIALDLCSRYQIISSHKPLRFQCRDRPIRMA